MELRDIENIQKQLKKDILKALNNGSFQKTIDLIDCFADVTQRINNILRDDDIEGVIKSISDSCIDSTIDIIGSGDTNTILLYDQIGTTTCLSLQYLRGLAANGYKIIYIYENSAPISQELFEEVKKVSSESYIINSKKVYSNNVYLGQKIRNLIINANPSKILVHPQATGALGMTVLHSIKGAKKFRIIPGDHHFYIGYECIDFFIEFRPFGWSTAVYERKIPKNKIYNLNFYPILDEFIPFAGFPKETNGKIIVGAGGSTYKFQGSEFFYETIKTILNFNSNSVFVYMGGPSKELIRLSKDPCFKNRIFLIGYRKDFAAIMKNIDILINSIPFSGGLFCQTAASYSKPILSYSDTIFFEENAVEDILSNAKLSEKITLTSKEDFFNHAKKLLEDVDYRSKWGKYANKILQSKPNFDAELKSIIENRYPTLDNIDIKYVDRSPRINLYMQIRSKNDPEHLMPIVRLQKIRFLKYLLIVPRSIMMNIQYIFHHLLASYIKK